MKDPLPLEDVTESGIAAPPGVYVVGVVAVMRLSCLILCSEVMNCGLIAHLGPPFGREYTLVSKALNVNNTAETADAINLICIWEIYKIDSVPFAFKCGIGVWPQIDRCVCVSEFKLVSISFGKYYYARNIFIACAYVHLFFRNKSMRDNKWFLYFSNLKLHL
jgi:hypothetical protein